jgi:hypothetical protein
MTETSLLHCRNPSASTVPKATSQTCGGTCVLTCSQAFFCCDAAMAFLKGTDTLEPGVVYHPVASEPEWSMFRT